MFHFPKSIWISKVTNNLLLGKNRKSKTTSKYLNENVIINRTTVIHTFSNVTLRSQTLANICEMFQIIYYVVSIYILRTTSGVLFAHLKPALFLRWHLVMFCVIIANIWWDTSNSYMARGWSAFLWVFQKN